VAGGRERGSAFNSKKEAWKLLANKFRVSFAFSGLVAISQLELYRCLAKTVKATAAAEAAAAIRLIKRLNPLVCDQQK